MIQIFEKSKLKLKERAVSPSTAKARSSQTAKI